MLTLPTQFLLDPLQFSTLCNPYLGVHTELQTCTLKERVEILARDGTFQPSLLDQLCKVLLQDSYLRWVLSSCGLQNLDSSSNQGPSNNLSWSRLRGNKLRCRW